MDFSSRFNFKMKAQWPEFRSCFGLCSLRIGVYIIAAIGLILHGGSIVWNCIMLTTIIYKRNLINSIDCSTLTEHNITEEAIETLMYWSTIGCAYYGMWLLIKCIIFVNYGVLFFGIWKSKLILLKIYMYIYAPYWIITLVNACVLVYFVSMAYNVLIVGILIIHTYLMLIVRSTYREMSGKRRFLERPITNDAHNCTVDYEPYENPPEYTLPISRADNPPHCNSCSCSQRLTGDERNLEENRGGSPVVQSPTSSETRQLVANTPKKEVTQKELNFKDEHIIYDQNQLQTSHSCVIENRLNNMTERPSSSNLDENNYEVKKNIEDVPRIFDQSQLNVGTSLLFENMPVIGSHIKSEDNLQNVSPHEKVLSKTISNAKPDLNKPAQLNEHQDGIKDSEINVIKIPRPKTLALKTIEKSKVLKHDEIPVIYDLHLLNDGSSPVAENSRCSINKPATLIVECKNINIDKNISRPNDEE